MSARRLALAAVLLGGLVSACGDESAPSKPPPPSEPGAPPPVTASQDAGVSALARLEALRGAVQLERDGGLTPAAEGPLMKGDALETGPDGSATVRFADGRTVEVGPNARFVLDEDTGGIVLKVARGIVLSRVPAAPKVRTGPSVELRILTPYGLTRVSSAQPSEVSVSVGPEDSRVEVRMGAIQFVSKDGQELEASAGQSVDVSAGRAELVTGPQRVLELATIQVTVRADSGKVEVRSKGSSQWRTANKGGQKLSPGDGVRARGGTAYLALEGSASTIALASGSEVVLEGAGKQGSQDEARLDLRQGSLTLKLAPERDSRVVMPGLTLESAGAADLKVRRTADGFDVSARAGDVTLVRGDTRKPLRAGEQASVSGQAEPKVSPLAQAPVALPAVENMQVFHRGLPEVKLSWAGEGDVLLEVASDPAFTRTVVRGVVHQPYATVPAPERGRLYWRVRRPDGTELTKGSATFAPEQASKDLARVTNEVPEGPQKTTIFYQDKPPAVVFKYSAEPQAAQYRIAVYRNGELSKPVAERTVAETRAPLEAGVLREGNYLWSVTPLSRTGQPLRGGRMNKLELVYDNSVPVLVVQSPKNGQRVGKRVRAVGVAPVGTKLSINERSVSLDAKHRFDTWVEPVGVPPVLLFKMQHAGAPDVYVVRTLKRGSEE
ncbi:FecR domain-containing protein [Hyalangium minutum]|uniref:Putative lipoprotein n=1 Tax=Hyalangium minutum TaxID=394096 RepID=A0A085W2J2_9BACT|nr:putative lipoprotein [Hyalangium minutum]